MRTSAYFGYEVNGTPEEMWEFLTICEERIREGQKYELVRKEEPEPEEDEDDDRA